MVAVVAAAAGTTVVALQRRQYDFNCDTYVNLFCATKMMIFSSSNITKSARLWLLLLLSLELTLTSFAQDDISHFSLMMPNVRPMQVREIVFNKFTSQYYFFHMLTSSLFFTLRMNLTFAHRSECREKSTNTLVSIVCLFFYQCCA